MVRRDRLVVATCAALLSACGYPDFAFEPPDQSDASDDTSFDVGTNDAHADSGAPSDSSHDGSLDAVDTDVAADTSSSKDTSIVDSIAVDTKPDVVVVDTTSIDTTSIDTTPDTSIDAPDASPTCALIDDMEDDDGYILVRCGRSGTWYTYNDGTGSQVPPEGTLPTPSIIVGGRGSSMYAMDTTGAGFTSWGAGIGFNFIDGGPSYDASAWSGVQFWARSGGSTGKTLHMGIADKDTDGRGGICATKTGGCGDHFHALVDITTTWTLYSVNFSDLKQAGWGYVVPTGFDASAIYGVQWGIDSGSPFDIWIDDVSFF
jgi:hypothetical protein